MKSIKIHYLSGVAKAKRKTNTEKNQKMFDTLVKQLKQAEGVTEQLKADNQMAWFARMNDIRNRATEIVNHDIIFN